MLKYTSIILSIIVLLSCNRQQKNDKKANEIIKKCVEAHGGSAYDAIDVSFDFRQFRYHIKQNGTEFLYERIQKDSLNNEIKDVLTNTEFKREINGVKQNLSAKDDSKYREGTNSIAYFILLPYKLLDKAVNSEYIGTSTINGQQYDKIKIWFDKEGGGKDYDDVFCYWINQQTHTLDYLAYDNGGPRFRKATKREKVNGIIFQDYENYEIADTLASTSDYDKFFVEGKVKLLSKIEQTNYTVNGK